MAIGIIIHVSVGQEKKTEFFSEDRLRIGSDESCDLQIQIDDASIPPVWLELENTDGVFRIIKFAPELSLTLNDSPIRRYVGIKDGDVVKLGVADVSLSFFALASRSSLIASNREQPHIAQFIEEAALESAASPRRDDAKIFLREFTRELMSEISWTSKAITLVLAVGFISGILYLGYAVNRELRESRKTASKQNDLIVKLEEKLGQTNDQIGELDKTNKDLIRLQSLGQNVRVDYGNAVCLIVGIYDLVDRRSGKTLRYRDPSAYDAIPYEPSSEDGTGMAPKAPQGELTTEGGGSPVEYDFIGTGFHVGGGYIVTNRHVLQPWSEDDMVKQMMRNSNGRARIKKLVIYFPKVAQPFPLKVLETGGREDVAVASVDASSLPADIAAVPLETDESAAAIGKTVVTMGYPSGPDRLLAMVDDDEAKSINSRFGNSRENLINFLAQSGRIVPLTTQGTITDLDPRRIVHDARTAEGGSGAPLFGEGRRVIGVNFGVFTENTAANMAVPIKFAVDLLRKAGWRSPEEMQTATAADQTAANTANTSIEK